MLIPMNIAETVRALFVPGKGILAADESVASANRRLSAVGAAPSAALRDEYRELFLGEETAPTVLSGVIFHEETLGQDIAGKPFGIHVAERGILPGIKVDEGLEDANPGSPEKLTKGLSTLPERLAGYAVAGMRFAKWRAVVPVGASLPSSRVLEENALRMARYAAECTQQGILPIIEPEVLRDPDPDVANDATHTRAQSRATLARALAASFAALVRERVPLSEVVLKTSFAVSGADNPMADAPEEVAHDTAAVLLDTVPPETAGVVFLSGGLSPAHATAYLAAFSAHKNLPWPVTFSYARALQQEALHVWQGKPENLAAARQIFRARLALVSKASQGVYDAAGEAALAEALRSATGNLSHARY